jgi:hypothetical protein
MHAFSQSVADNQVNLALIQQAVLDAYAALLEAPTLTNKIIYWEAHDNYMDQAC